MFETTSNRNEGRIISKKVYINALFLSYTYNESNIYAYELIRALDSLLLTGEINPLKYSLELLSPRLNGAMPVYEKISIHQVGRMYGKVWEQFELLWATRGNLLLSLMECGPLFKRMQAIAIHCNKQISTFPIYDSTFKIPKIILYSLLIKSTRYIIVSSLLAKTNIVERYNINPDKVHIIPLGSSHMLNVKPDPAVFYKYGFGQKPFFIVISNKYPSGNLSLLVEAINTMTQRNFDVVILAEGFKSIYPVISASRGEVKALYYNAVGVIFPAKTDGFNLELIEAMFCGCPVICSNIDSFQETCGSAALYFDPNRPRDLAQKIITMLIDPSLQSWLRYSGIRQAEKYSWLSSARQLWKLCEKSLTLE